MGDDVKVAIDGSKTRQRRRVRNFVLHPKFDLDLMQNDIAVIRVWNLIESETNSSPHAIFYANF